MSDYDDYEPEHDAEEDLFEDEWEDDLDDEDEDDFDDDDDDLIDGVGFADPGGESALRAETSSNPRNLPCPTCKEPNRLTPIDRRRGYQCDDCADQVERGY